MPTRVRKALRPCHRQGPRRLPVKPRSCLEGALFLCKKAKYSLRGVGSAHPPATHSLIHSSIHSLHTHSSVSPYSPHPRARSFSHPCTPSPDLLSTRSLEHPLPYAPAPLRTRSSAHPSLIHSLTHSLIHPSTHSFSHLSTPHLPPAPPCTRTPAHLRAPHLCTHLPVQPLTRSFASSCISAPADPCTR